MNCSRLLNPVALILVGMLLFCAATLHAQQTKKITGKILSDKGVLLSGAVVTARDGSGKSVVADSAGVYTITVNSSKASLLFTYIGHDSLWMPVNNRGVINVILTSHNAELDQVVVIGYAQVKKKDVTGSVGTVKIEDLQKAPVRSFEEALAGRVAGVQVSALDGQPGAAYNIVIRGNNSVTQDNSPLYVIDGFPVENPNNNVISPEDIESMDVLKDASATAIYGARGANGVIIINTKRGKGKASVTFNSNFGYNQAIKKMELLSPYEFVKLQLENFAAAAQAAYLSDSTTLESYRDVKGINWQDLLLQKGAFKNYNLATRGSTANNNYSISLNVMDQDGIIINSGFKRYSGRVVVDQKINPKLKVGVNANYTYTKSFGNVMSSYGGATPFASVLGSAWVYRPITGSPKGDNFEQNNEDLIENSFDPDVNPASDYRYNPVINTQNVVNDRFSNTINANGYAQYEIIPGLAIKVTAGISNSFNKTNIFYNSHTYSGDRRSIGGLNGPNGSIVNTQVFSYLNENTLTYNKTFNKDHQLNVLGGITFQGAKTSGNGFSAGSLPNEELGIPGLDEGVATTTTSNETQNKLMSYLGRVTYNFKSTYYLTASFRADGSSKFSSQNHWGYFPSGGFSWRFSNENFMRKQNFVTDAKLRVTYGLTGNNRVSDFATLPTIVLPATSGYSFGNSIYPGASFSALGNKDLKWETTSQFNAGLDIEVLKKRVNLTVDYYKKETDDLLLNASLPGSTGFASAFANIGKVQNSGWEFTLNTININNGAFNWESSFNISFNRNKVLALADNQEALLSFVSWSTNSYSSLPSFIAKIGQPISLFYGYVFDGVYQVDDFTKNSAGTYVLKDNIPSNTGPRTSVQPGNAKFKDINGDGTVDAKDQTVIGNPNPKFFGGFSNNFRYKGFDLNIFFQWSYGNEIENANRYVFEGGIGSSRNQFASFANRWTFDNQTSSIPNNNGPAIYSSRVIEDGSFLRLKTLQLGYSIPGKPLTKTGIKNLRFYVSGQNLITWTKYSGPDPEVSIFNTALKMGFDYSAYPKARTLTAGIDITF